MKGAGLFCPGSASRGETGRVRPGCGHLHFNREWRFELQVDIRRLVNFLEAGPRNYTLARLQVVDSIHNPPVQKLIDLIDLWEQALLPI